MMKDKIIAVGAEAKLYLNKGHIIKDRIVKGYRIKEIDQRLRKQRTKKEAKILDKLRLFDFVPSLIIRDEYSITIEYIRGITLRDAITKNNYKELMQELAEKIAIIHNLNIIHGDLTTSNFIYDKKIYIIDFGLSFESEKIEHKAVDIHLLRQALESKHSDIWEMCYSEFTKTYKNKCKDGIEILERLRLVEKRGRYK